ncbi:MAG: hypothetical protein HYW27_04390 [Candidatus Aenigmarchaeota archaeon]|nr:hypothetical protein [Candidatus Aenigmarchaeota archaeon]
MGRAAAKPIYFAVSCVDRWRYFAAVDAASVRRFYRENGWEEPRIIRYATLDEARRTSMFRIFEKYRGLGEDGTYILGSLMKE